MNRTSFLRAALLCSALALVPAAGYATSGGEGNNTNCNGRGNSNSPCAGTPAQGGNGGNGGAGGQGGTGGQGGAGGHGVGIGVGVGVGGQGGRGGNARAEGGNANARGGNARAAGGNATGGNGTGGAGGNANVTVQGGGNGFPQGGTYRVANVPDAYAPPISGGANPCTVGVSLGGSLVGGGASAGITWNDDDCEARVRSILLHNYGRDRNDPRLLEASVELLCDHRPTRRAMQRAGTPCMQDRPAAAEPVAQTQMTSVRATTVQPVVVAPTGCPAGQFALPAPYQHICR